MLHNAQGAPSYCILLVDVHMVWFRTPGAYTHMLVVLTTPTACIVIARAT